MIRTPLKNAIRLALRVHEIGRGSPYRLCFARKGTSGASFGFMQGDLAAGQQEVRDAFRKCLTSTDYSAADIRGLMAQLGVPCPRNPLSTEETERINSALEVGKTAVDQMDEVILGKVIRDVDRCIEAARETGRIIADETLIYIALWINMTGAPTELLRWLRGGTPRIAHSVPPADNPVSATAMQNYLRASYYYAENPQNFDHLRACVAEGAVALERS